MIAALAIAGALEMLTPHVSATRADSFAAIIAGLASTTAEAAALVVTGARESEWRLDLERCIDHGLDGDGLFGLGFGYRGAACAAPETQARVALRALHDKGWEVSPLRAFAGYLGASERHHEARARLAMWTVTSARIECSCGL